MSLTGKSGGERFPDPCRKNKCYLAFILNLISEIYDEYDLFGVKIDPNGLAGDFFQLTNTGYDENSLYTSSGYYSSICCWESEGNIYVAEPQISQDTLVLEGIEILDSVDCYDPVCQEYYVAWRKVENNESHIYYSEKNISSNQWSVPVAIIDTGNNVNLSLAVSVPDVGGGYNLCWQANNRIYLSELSGYYMFSPEIPGIEYYYEPVAFNVLLVTDVIYGFYSFAGGIVSQRDIFIVDEDVSNYMLNITDDPYVNKNPRLFAGRGNYYYFEIINIWQTEMNGNDVLFGSFARYNVVIGSVDENEMSELDIYPIPFTETLNIDFIKDKAELTILEIFTISGKRVLQREIQGQANILQSITWSPESEGVTLSEGIYFVKLKLGESSIVRKVVYSK